MPDARHIGYLDQHYSNLPDDESVLGAVSGRVPEWQHVDVRKHLNDFLFRSNEQVNKPVSQLSGGERVRLSLALIAAQTPRLLILDEITNNLDLETKSHVVDVLKAYPGAMIVISHDESFVQQLALGNNFKIGEDCLRE
ncbi:ATP-binding cassette domain-containing protein [Parendozoicomonas haliclonae]|uniref:Putative ABC transporter ATP-binding protein n=1 Tax=Parendozoicomonas haliclonae TaxID=1960125 RepID=A0A1X7AIQ3_9GAMM|nr:ATP-binding cassette domain-containing protein [Parendozoicomonas haliclonae]SMA44125.1 putative ABC transporter ATP-binding protein [Parendozoicomonas haliclonae]